MELIVWLFILTCVSLIIVVTDIAFFWIPDAAVLALSIEMGAASWRGMIEPNLWACLAVMLFFLLIYGLYPEGMGSGDVKLAAALSLGCTAGGALVMVYVAFFSALAVAVLMMILNRCSVIPFGPFLLMGWWCAFLLEDTLMQWLFSLAAL